MTGACATGAFGAETTSTVAATESASATDFFATAFFATAFFATAFLAAAFFTGAFSSVPSSDFFAAAFFTAFFTGFGSSGCTSRTRPSRCAFVRTRSACCSIIVEDCVFTPMPILPHKSRVS
jgi:hypothetical protein